MSLTGKNIIVGISGGIAAYKTLSLIRLFIKNGANVKVVVTPNALQFVTKLSLQTLSKNNIYDSVFSEINNYSTEHISLTDWADVMIVAPATANIVGKFANGIADDALSTTFLAFNKSVFIAPAMNNKMYENSAVQQNLQTLTQRGVHIIEPPIGELACGCDGKGRMEEPEAIFECIAGFFLNSKNLFGKTALVTAGPTYEAIDPVRFIGNHSSGLMGICIADELANRGAEVVLVCGPSEIKSKNSMVKRVDVVSAKEMFEVCKKYFENVDITVCSAAVADYAPKQIASQKIKKTSFAQICNPCENFGTDYKSAPASVGVSDTERSQSVETLTLELVKTPDVLRHLGEQKTQKQFLVGFALETENEFENAENKLKSKHLDMLVLNSLNDKGAGFGHTTNKISILFPNEKPKHFELKSKAEVARDIVLEIANRCHPERSEETKNEE